MGKIKAVIFDIDKCLADTETWDEMHSIGGVRYDNLEIPGKDPYVMPPFDMMKWFNRNRNPEVNPFGKAMWVSAVISGLIPLFVTGRSDIEDVWENTEDWLKNNGLWMPQSVLCLREKGDGDVPDAVVKEKLWRNRLMDDYDVVAAIDDKLSIVKMWTNVGIQGILIANKESFRM
jgi:hypothetical protein